MDNAEVSRIFCEVLEKQAFLFADPVDAGSFDAGDGGFIAVDLAFSGDAKGSFTLALPERMAGELAANIMGLDSGDPDAEAASRDACKEFLNVAAGNILP